MNTPVGEWVREKGEDSLGLMLGWSPWLVTLLPLVAWQQFVAAGSLRSFNNLPCLIEIRASAGSFTWRSSYCSCSCSLCLD